MIKSMTGFGRAEHSDGKRNIMVEIRTVNHRYMDIGIRMPRRYSFAEERIRNAVKETAKRGKIDVAIIIESITEGDVNIRLNEMVARQYLDNLKALKSSFDLTGEITLQFLATLPDVMKAIPDVEEEEAVCAVLEAAVRQAALKLDSMRAIEGKKLAEDLLQRGENIRGLVREVEARSPLVAAAYVEKMRERIKELIGGGVIISEERILAEAAIFADKSSITEELVRLDSHISQFRSIIEKSTQPEGKKLDFLVQEMNREANTIGSKANDIDITRQVLEMKSEIEKIREQVQNIE